MSARAVVLLAALTFPACVFAQPGSEDDPIEVEIVEDVSDEETNEGTGDQLPSQPRFVAGMWCPLKQSADESPQRPSGEEGGENSEDDEDSSDSAIPDSFDCDFGGGMRLVGRCFAQGCASLIGALGAKSLGFGLAWTVIDIGNNPVSVALGVAAPYDGEGVYVDRASVVIGGTVGFGGR